jgi:hypothetical protein
VTSTCANGWEALRADPLPWLLDDLHPNLKWRVLVELVRRPKSSPAVRRARGGANASEPIASLLRDLSPDGTWMTAALPWTLSIGSAWRLISAVQWGADPDDPRLHAAAERHLAEARGEGGFARSPQCGPEPWLTARALQAFAVLGWTRHPRFQEGLAWLEEPDVDWGSTPTERAETAAAVLASLAETGLGNRSALRDRSIGVLEAFLAAGGGSSRLGFPNLHRTDLAEILWSLALAGAPFEASIAGALRRLQHLQLEGARWARTVEIPRSLPIPDEHRPGIGQPSRWITLRATVALLAYAVAAKLPRMYPPKPGG